MKNYSWLIILFFPSITWAQSSLLTIDDAVKMALQNNYAVQIVSNDTVIGKINNNWANAGAVPVVSATANRTIATNNIEQQLQNGTNIKTNGASVNNFNAGLTISWRFFDGMKMFATKKRLEEIEKLGQYNFRKMANETVYDVMAAYYNIIRLKQQANAIKEVITLFSERLKIAEAKFNIGSSSKTDILQAKVDRNEQQSNLLSIENNISNSKTILNNLLARDPATGFETADSFNIHKTIDFAGIQQKTENQNPEILLAQSNLAVLMHTKKEINSQRLPSATLSGNYNFIHNKNAAGFTLLNQSYGPSTGLGISIPIFNGGIVKRQLEVADINIKNQQLLNQQIKNQLQTALTNSYLNYNNGLKLMAMENENMVIVKENNFINLERFKKLSITSIELRQGQVNYTDAQTRLINAMYQTKMAEAEMLLLAGEIAN